MSGENNNLLFRRLKVSKAKKNEGFEALRDALIIRKKITNVVKVLALQSQRQLEAAEEWLANAKDDSEILSAKT